MKQIILATFFLVLFATLTLSQTTDAKSPAASPNLLEKIDLKFSLTGTPSPEDVGFDDRNGSWKLKYTLLLSDEKTTGDLISKAYINCKNTNTNYQKCAAKANKKLGKQFEKVALFISHGAFRKNSLSSENQREILIPVKFMPDVVSIFNKAEQSAENPVFLLQIKGKVSAKTSAEKKVKCKTSVGFQYPLKLVRRDGSFDFYNISVFGAAVGIGKGNEGMFSCSIYKQ